MLTAFRCTLFDNSVPFMGGVDILPTISECNFNLPEYYFVKVLQ